MTRQCKPVNRGHYLGGAWETVSEEETREAKESSPDGRRLLFRPDSGISAEDFSPDFGDCGNAYCYIRREDLSACRFDRVWLIQQCF